MDSLGRPSPQPSKLCVTQCLLEQAHHVHKDDTGDTDPSLPQVPLPRPHRLGKSAPRSSRHVSTHPPRPGFHLEHRTRVTHLPSWAPSFEDLALPSISRPPVTVPTQRDTQRPHSSHIHRTQEEALTGVSAPG